MIRLEPWRAASLAAVLWFGLALIWFALASGRVVVAGLCFAAMAGATAAILQNVEENPPD